MLRFMRDYATSWFIKVILGAIVIVFIFWGVGNFGSQRETKSAVVNGELITMEEYRNAYNNLLERYRQNFGGKLNEDMIERLKGQALDGLIDQKLILQEASRLNFQISKEELAKSIMKMTVFQSDGVFDNTRYRKILGSNRLNPEEFEAIQRESLLEQKVRDFIFSNIKVSDQEALEWFQWENASVSIDYALFSPETYEYIEPSEEELNAFFDKNKENYKTEPQVKAQFLRFETDAYKSEAKVTDEEIRDYYEEHPKEFEQEKTVEARHILIKTDEKDAPEVVEEKKQKALEILKMAQEGQDFAELAKTHSEDPGSKDKGGALGAFTKNRMVKPFSDKAFSMKPGEISDPVKTRFGWHIIKVEKVNETKTLSLEEAKGKITSRLASEKAKNLAYDAAEEVYDAFFEGDDLAKVAKARNFEVLTTDFFTKKGPDKDVRNRWKFATVAFELGVMDISEIQDMGDGYYLIQILEKKEPEQSEFEDVKEKVQTDFVREKQDEKAKTDADALLAALKEKGNPLETESEKYGVEVKTTDFFKRTGAIPEVGYEREITQTAFQLSDEKTLPENIIKGKKGYYLIRFKERKTPDAEAFEKEKTQVQEKLLQRKKYKAFDEWITQIKTRSDIQIFI